MLMNRLIMHHSDGPYRSARDDLAAYHRATDGDGQVHQGNHAIAANSAGQRLVPGRYAMRCKNLNSGSIGSVICAMGDAKWGNPFASTSFPVKPVPVDAMLADSARLCAEFGIVPNRRFTLSHAEVQLTLGVDQESKWDFDYALDGSMASRNAVAVGDELRQELRRIMGNVTGQAQPVAKLDVPPTIPIGDAGDHVEHLQSLLGGLLIDGQFGPKSRSAVIKFQRMRELLPDGVVGPMTWAALTS